MSSEPQREEAATPSPEAPNGASVHAAPSLLSLSTRQELLQMPSPSQIGLMGLQHYHHNHSSSPHHDHGHVEDGFMSPEDIRHLLGGVLGDDEDDEDDHGGNGRGANKGNHNHNHNHHHSLGQPQSNIHNAALGESAISITAHTATSAASCSAVTAVSSPPSLAGENSNHGNGSSFKLLLRTERKRTREKQRRSDVNKQFHELTALLRRLETEDPDEFNHLPPYSPSNRVELMDRTVRLLSTLYDRNKKRKVQIADLKSRLEASQKAGEETAAKLKEAMMAPQNVGGNRVMMMVPMLINAPSAGGGQGGAAAATVAASAAEGPQTVMPFQPWMSSFMGMPTEATPMAMMGHPNQHAAMASMAAHHHAPAAAMPMSFFMPMSPSPSAPSSAAVAMQAAASTTGAVSSSAAAPASAEAAASGAPSSPATSASTGDLKQEAKVGSNLAHCA